MKVIVKKISRLTKSTKKFLKQKIKYCKLLTDTSVTKIRISKISWFHFFCLRWFVCLRCSIKQNCTSPFSHVHRLQTALDHRKDQSNIKSPYSSIQAGPVSQTKPSYTASDKNLKTCRAPKVFTEAKTYKQFIVGFQHFYRRFIILTVHKGTLRTWQMEE